MCSTVNFKCSIVAVCVLLYSLSSSHAMHQKLDADSEDSYMNSNWADTQSLKRQLAGVSNVTWKPT